MASRSLSVDENAGLVTVGLPVTGTDVDVGQTLTYSLGLSGNTGTVFGINAVSGQVSIIVAGALDFEKQSVYVYLRLAACECLPEFAPYLIPTSPLAGRKCHTVTI